jgi:hypothetical protein
MDSWEPLMPRRLIVSLSVAVGLVALPCTAFAARPEPPRLFTAAGAGTASSTALGAASTQPQVPVVKLVSPVELSVGDEITITGENFTPGPLRNQLVFLRPGIRPVFVPVELAEEDEIRLHLPAKLLPFLRRENGKGVATRFRITVLSRLFGPLLTPTVLSPLIKPPPAGVEVAGAKDCDGDGVADTPMPDVLGLAVVGLGLEGVPEPGDELPDIPDVIGAPGLPDVPLPDDLPPESTPAVPETPPVPGTQAPAPPPATCPAPAPAS